MSASSVDGDVTSGTLPEMLSEHLAELAFLWLQRDSAVDAPHYDRQQFADLDEQLAAHLDGVRVAGTAGWTAALETTDDGGADSYFGATVLAFDAPERRLPMLLERLAANRDAMPGVVSALGWVDAARIAPARTAWLASKDPLERKLALAACELHRVDPGPALAQALGEGPDSVRIRALRLAGSVGRTDLLPFVLDAVNEAKPELRWRAATAGLLLGDRDAALATLMEVASVPGPRRLPAMCSAMHAMTIDEAHAALARLKGAPAHDRLRVIGAGHAGNPHYVAWLIDLMTVPALARIAGEAFVHITGADFNLEQLEAMPPEGFEDGPTDDPDDEHVELPEDIALPWPDVERVRAWWNAHGSEFATGQKLFLGKPVTAEHCIHVLDTGYQRQRVIAAHHRALIQPGTVLFPTSAPAWRQQKLLGVLQEGRSVDSAD